MSIGIIQYITGIKPGTEALHILPYRILRTLLESVIKRERGSFCYARRVFTLFFSLICTLNAFGQNEPQLSKAFALPTAVNPGAVGHHGQIGASAAFRQQWVGFEGAPTQFFLAADAEIGFLKNFHGIGIAALQDKAGAVTALNLSLAYSYHIYLSDGMLGLGLKFGVYNVKFEAGSLLTTPIGLTDDFHQESDQILQNADDSKSAFDVGFGAFYKSDVSYLSLSLLHLTAPELLLNSDARYNVRPVLTAGAGRLIGKDIKNRTLEPRIDIRTDFASFQMDMSLNVNLRQKIWFGIGYRLQDALIFGAGVKLNNGLSLAYSYDLSLSKLKAYNSGSHEIVAAYFLDLDREKPTKKYKSVRIL